MAALKYGAEGEFGHSCVDVGIDIYVVNVLYALHASKNTFYVVTYSIGLVHFFVSPYVTTYIYETLGFVFKEAVSDKIQVQALYAHKIIL